MMTETSMASVGGACLSVEQAFGGLYQILRPVQPVVGAVQLGTKEAQVVISIYWKAREKETIMLPADGADDSGNAILVAVLGQQVRQSPGERLVVLGKSIG